MFNWDRTFANTNVNEKAFILNKTTLNILSNFFPHEILTVDDKQRPTLIYKKNKKSRPREKNVYKSYRNSKENNNIRTEEIESSTTRPT